MSQTVDNRVVQMRFDNEQFEKGAAVSIATLEKLKSSLKFEKTSEGLENLSKSMDKFDVSTMTDGADKIASRFGAMEIVAISAIANITNKVVDLGLQLVKSLSVDPIMEGFSKYESELKSIQTIMVTTGNDISYVTEEMRRLGWYTDETSYSYSDMVENIAKFTSQGIGLSEAVSSMQGIANMAGYAGASVQDATHAMEGFSKAMGAGFMSKQNWQWIQTAHMETQQVKEIFIDAAVECGTLTRGIDGVARTAKGAIVDIGNFAENLKEQWLTSEVMDYANQSMSEYSDFLSAFISRMEEFSGESLTCSEYMEMLDQTVKNGSETFENSRDLYAAVTLALNDLGIELGEDCTSYEYLNYLISSNSRIGFEQAQMYRTLGDAISATTTAVATGWKEIFGYLFGNAEDARTLWSFVGDTLYDVFVTDLNEMKGSLQGWYDASGFMHILSVVENIVNGIGKVVVPIRNSLKTLIPTPTVDQIYNFTSGLEKFTDALIWSDEASKGFNETLDILLKPLNIVKEGIIVIAKGVTWVSIFLSNLTEVIFEEINALSELGDAIKDYFTDLFNLKNIGDTITDIFYSVRNSLYALGNAIGEALSIVLNSESMSQVFGLVAKSARFLGETIGGVLCLALDVLEKINFSRIISAFDKVGTAFFEFAKKIKLSDKLGQIIDKIVYMFDKITTAVLEFVENTNLGERLTSFIEKFIDALVFFFDRVEAYLEETGLDKDFEALFNNVLDSICIFTDGVLKMLSAESFGEALDTAINTILATFGILGSGINDVFNTINQNGGSEIIGKLFKDIGDAAKQVTGAEESFKKTAAGMEEVENMYLDLCTVTVTPKEGSVVDFTQGMIRDDGVAPTKKIEETSNAITMIGDAVKNVGENFNVGSLGVAAFAGSMVYLAISIGKIFTGFAYAVKSFGYIGDGFWELTKTLSVCAKQIKNSVVALFSAMATSSLISSIGTLTAAVGAAIYLIATGLAKLGEIDPGTLWSSVGALTVLIAVMEGFTVVMVKLMAGWKSAIDPKALVTEFAGLLIVFSAMSILLNAITSCVVKLASIKEGLGSAVSTIAVIWLMMMAFAGMALTVNTYNVNILKFGQSIALMATAINLMVTPLLILSFVKTKMDPREGLGIIIGLVTLFVLIGHLTEYVKGLGSDLRLFATSMILFGTAINLLVLPILILSMIPSEKIDIGASVVFGMMLLYIGIGAMATKLTGFTSNMVLFATAMVILSAALNGMVSALLIASLIPEDKIAQAAIAVGGCFAALVIIGAIASFVEKEIVNFLTLAGSLALLAVAVNLIVAPIVTLGYIPRNVLIQGGIAAAILLVAITCMSLIVSKGKELNKGILQFSVAMAALSLAIDLLIPAVVVFGYIAEYVNLGMIAQGGAIVLGFLAIMLLLSKLVTSVDGKKISEDIIQFGFAVFAMSIAVGVLGAVIVAMNYLLPEVGGALTCSVALGAVVLSLVAIITSVKDSGVGWGDVALVAAIEASLFILVGALLLLQNVNWSTLLASAGAMVIVLLAISGSLILLSKAKVGIDALFAGGAIASVCVSILALAVALNIISNVNLEGLKGLIGVMIEAAKNALWMTALGVALVVFGAGASDAGVGLTALGSGLVVFGAGMVVLGVAAVLFATLIHTLAALAPIAKEAANAFLIFVSAVSTAAPLIGLAIGTIIVGIAKTIKDSAVHIMEAINVIVTAIVLTLTENAKTIASALMAILKELIDLLIEYFPKIVDMIIGGLTQILKAVNDKWLPLLFELINNILVGILDTIVKFIPRLVTAGTDIVVSIITGIGNGLYRITEAAWNTVITFINGISEGIDVHGPELKKAVNKLIISIIKFLSGTENLKNLINAGKNAVAGFIKGVNSEVKNGSVYNAGWDMGQEYQDGITENLDINSPSKVTEMFGKYSVKGFCVGAKSLLPDVFQEGDSTGAKYAEGLTDTDNIARMKGGGAVLAANVIKAVGDFGDDAEDSGETLGQRIYNGVVGFLKLNPLSRVISGTEFEFANVWSADNAKSTALWSLSSEMTGDDYAQATGQMAKGNEEVATTTKEVGSAAKETLKTFDELISEYSYGSEEVKNFLARHQKAIEKNYDFASALDVANYAVSRLATSLYEANGGVLESTYETQEELESILGSIQQAYNDTADAIYSTFASFDPWSEASLDTGTVADISKMIVQFQDQAEDMDFFSAALDDFLKDSRIDETMKQAIVSMGTSGLQYIRMFNEASDDDVETLLNEYKYINEMMSQYTTDAMTSWSEGVINWGEMTKGNMLVVAHNINTELSEGLDINAGTSNAKTMALNVVTAMSDALDLGKDVSQPRAIGTKAVQGFADGITANLVISTTAGAELATVTLEGVAQTTRSKSDTVNDSGVQVGKYLVYGLADGVGDPEANAKLMEAIENMVSNVISKTEEGFGEKSPSKVFKKIGKYLDEGLAIGIKTNTNLATSAAEDLATATTTSFSSMLSDVYNIISGEVDFDPVIRPTLDLSKVQEGASQLGAMLNSNKVAANASLYGTNQNGANSGATYQFTQNNYSPKSLSRVDIYRQTKNQFAMMKGVANS